MSPTQFVMLLNCFVSPVVLNTCCQIAFIMSEYFITEVATIWFLTDSPSMSPFFVLFSVSPLWAYPAISKGESVSSYIWWHVSLTAAQIQLIKKVQREFKQQCIYHLVLVYPWTCEANQKHQCDHEERAFGGSGTSHSSASAQSCCCHHCSKAKWYSIKDQWKTVQDFT